MIIHEEPSPNSVSSPVSTAKDSRCYTVEDLLKVLRLTGKAYACGSCKAKNCECIDLPQFGNQTAFVIFGVIQFYKAADAEQVCGTHGIRFAVPSVQQNIKGFDIQFRTQPDKFVIGGCNAADPLLATAFFKRKMNASQFGGLLECNGGRLPCKNQGTELLSCTQPFRNACLLCKLLSSVKRNAFKRVFIKGNNS